MIKKAFSNWFSKLDYKWNTLFAGWHGSFVRVYKSRVHLHACACPHLHAHEHTQMKLEEWAYWTLDLSMKAKTNRTLTKNNKKKVGGLTRVWSDKAVGVWHGTGHLHHSACRCVASLITMLFHYPAPLPENLFNLCLSTTSVSCCVCNEAS